MAKRVLIPILSIAINTFREAIRNKVVGTLFFFLVLASLGTALLAEMSVHEEKRVTADGVLFLSTIFSVAIAVHSTVTLLHTEIERRTIYTLLSKPIARWQFLLGKFMGVGLLLLSVTAVLMLVSLGLYATRGGEIHPTVLLAYLTLYFQLTIVIAVTLLFASFSSPLLSGMFTAGVFVAGNLVSQLTDARELVAQTSTGLALLIDALVVALPNFESLSLAPLVTYLQPVSPQYVLSAAWYSFSYCAVVMAVTITIFNRRNFQ